MPKVITKTAVEINGSVYQGGVPFEIDPYLYDSLVASGTTMILVEDQNKSKATEQSKKQEDQKELFSDKNEQPFKVEETSKVEEIQLEKEESVQIDNPEQDLNQSSGKKKK